jgi:hypothetical protein
MKYKLLVSDIAEPIAGIPPSLRLELPIIRLDTTALVLNNGHHSTYVKVLKAGNVADAQAISDVHLRIFDVDLPDDKWAPMVKEIVRKWVQIEAYSADLTILQQKVTHTSVSIVPWTLRKSLRDLSRVRSALAEITGMVREVSTEARWQSPVSNALILAESVKERLEAKSEAINARSTLLNYLLWIIALGLAIYTTVQVIT